MTKAEFITWATSRVNISPEGKLTGLLAHGCGSGKPASAEAIMGAL